MQIRQKQSAAPPPADDPLEYVMSDGSVDRMGDVMEPDGLEARRLSTKTRLRCFPTTRAYRSASGTMSGCARGS